MFDPVAAHDQEQSGEHGHQEITSPVNRASQRQPTDQKSEGYANSLTDLQIEIIGHVTVPQDQFRPGDPAVENVRAHQLPKGPSLEVLDFNGRVQYDLAAPLT